MPKTIKDRVEEVLAFYEIGDAETDIGLFVSEYRKDDGERVFENLWLFKDHTAMEAKNFVTESDYDFAPFRTLCYLRLVAKDYDFNKAREESGLIAEFTISISEVSGTLKASAENCDRLYHLVRTIIRPVLQVG